MSIEGVEGVLKVSCKTGVDPIWRIPHHLKGRYHKCLNHAHHIHLNSAEAKKVPLLAAAPGVFDRICCGAPPEPGRPPRRQTAKSFHKSRSTVSSSKSSTASAGIPFSLRIMTSFLGPDVDPSLHRSSGDACIVTQSVSCAAVACQS